MRIQSGFAPILIILILAAAVGGYIVYTNYSNNRTKPPPVVTQTNPTPKPTDSNSSTDMANWKTYDNQKYGLSFKYPPDWLLNERDVETDLVITANSPDEHNSSGVLDKGYSVYVNYSVKAGRSVDDLEKLSSKDTRSKDFTKTMLNGHEALKFLFQPPGTANRFEYIVVAFGHEIQFWCYFAISNTNGRSQCESIGSTLNILK